jgi:hypothetical protein
VPVGGLRGLAGLRVEERRRFCTVEADNHLPVSTYPLNALAPPQLPCNRHQLYLRMRVARRTWGHWRLHF